MSTVCNVISIDSSSPSTPSMFPYSLKFVTSYFIIIACICIDILVIAFSVIHMNLGLGLTTYDWITY